jgi:hypothetical protein
MLAAPAALSSDRRQHPTPEDGEGDDPLDEPMPSISPTHGL